jgi:flagellar motor switch/type III secretory pathway protein FliN
MHKIWTTSELIQTMPPQSDLSQLELGRPMPKAHAINALPSYSSKQAAMQSAAAQLLSDDTTYSVGVKPISEGLSFLCADGIRFQISDPAGAPLLCNPNDLEVICDALDDAHPILRAFETKLTLRLEPTDLVDALDPSQFVFLSLFAARLGVSLAIPSDYANADLWLQQAEQLVPKAADTPCLLKLQCVAAHLNIAQADDLADGDMLLMAPKLAMQIDAGPVSFNGVYDCGGGIFTATAEAVTFEGNSQMSDDDGAGNAPQFQIPVSIRLQDKMVSMETLAALKPGTNLPIAPLMQGLQVDVMIAGKSLASGEIVQIGDNFAVLIKERAALDNGPQAGELDNSHSPMDEEID